LSILFSDVQHYVLFYLATENSTIKIYEKEGLLLF
jgi:hypothetical protein